MFPSTNMTKMLVMVAMLAVSANGVALHKERPLPMTSLSEVSASATTDASSSMDISAWGEPESEEKSAADAAAAVAENPEEDDAAAPKEDVVVGDAEAVYRPPPRADVTLLKEFIRVEGDPSLIALDPVVEDAEYEEDPSAAPRAFKLQNLGSQPIVLALEDNALNNYKYRLMKAAKEGVMPMHKVATHPAPSSVYQALVPKPTYPVGSEGMPKGWKEPPPTAPQVLEAAAQAVKAGGDVEALIAAVTAAANPEPVAEEKTEAELEAGSDGGNDNANANANANADGA